MADHERVRRRRIRILPDVGVRIDRLASQHRFPRRLEADMKNILLLIHEDAGQEARLQAALDVTRAVDGHLTCLDVSVVVPMVGADVGVSGGAVLIELERENESGNRERTYPRLEKEDVSWSWIDTTNYLEPALEEAAGLADLIVVNRQLDSFPLPDMRTLASGLVVKSGKPVLAVPETAAGFRANGSALVAWDGSREASAALSAAVPLLRLADSVTIVEVEDGSVKSPAEEAAAYLSRHDVGATIVRTPAQRDDSGTVLLAKANSERFDYMVMGGFSHSRLYEAVFGGVTRRLLTYSQIPLFLAH
jgi:nucleotide-binding universal stress UspA family protein